MLTETSVVQRFADIRRHTEAICRSLQTEDYVIQPIADVSPPKWHLGHTTWFWEEFLLKPFVGNYRIFHEDFSFVFNSYYESVGKRVLRTNRGNLSRPTVEEVYRYRAYVDQHLTDFLENTDLSPEMESLLLLGMNHEQQHQELLVTDIKYILGHNPLFPSVDIPLVYDTYRASPGLGKPVAEGTYTIGYQGDGFCFDNELGVHKVYLDEYQLQPELITNAQYQEFIQSGGYQNFRYWLADGWAWVNENRIEAPMYWHKIDGQWWHYTFEGLKPVVEDDLVCHVSYYEAEAFARWQGTRLPTEFEWEVAAPRLHWGTRWEWTASAYLPYPGFRTAAGAVGEYNGKFMVNQMVLRGASEATPQGHSRPTYRNFFQPDKRWQFTGIRTLL